MRRLFIGIELPPTVSSAISGLIDAIKTGIRGNFVAADKLHITLVFLGDPELSNEELVRITKSHKVDRDIVLDGLGAFPSMSEPRVLFVRVRTDLTDVCSDIPGFDAKNFVPHVTVCRLNTRLAAGTTERLGRLRFDEKFRAKGMTLFSSDFKTYDKLA